MTLEPEERKEMPSFSIKRKGFEVGWTEVLRQELIEIPFLK